MKKESVLSVACVVLVLLSVAAGAVAVRCRAESGRLKAELAGLRAGHAESAGAAEVGPSAADAGATGQRARAQVDESAGAEYVAADPAAPADMKKLREELERKDAIIREMAARQRGNPRGRGADQASSNAVAGRPETQRTPEEEAQRVEERQRQRAEARERVATNLRDQYAAFSGVDVSGLPQEYQQSHAQLLEKMVAISERVAAAQQGATAEGDAGNWREGFREMREMRPLLRNEQDILLYNMQRQLGYAPADAWQLVEQIHTIDQLTSPGAMMGGRRGGDPQRGEQPRQQ